LRLVAVATAPVAVVEAFDEEARAGCLSRGSAIRRMLTASAEQQTTKADGDNPT
jgi:hypothetical protein